MKIVLVIFSRRPLRSFGGLCWWFVVVVSTLASINEVNIRRARLVRRWVTVFGLNVLVPDIYFGM